MIPDDEVFEVFPFFGFFAVGGVVGLQLFFIQGDTGLVENAGFGIGKNGILANKWIGIGAVNQFSFFIFGHRDAYLFGLFVEYFFHNQVVQGLLVELCTGVVVQNGILRI